MTNVGYAVTYQATTITLKVAKAADLSITGSAPSPVLNGTPYTYTFVVTNNGPSTAAAVKLTDKLPAVLTFVSASAGCTLVGSKVTCVLGSIANGGQVTVTITVTAASAGQVANTGSVKGKTLDITPANASKKVNVLIT